MSKNTHTKSFFLNLMILFIWGLFSVVYAGERKVILLGQLVDSISGRGIEDVWIHCEGDPSVSNISYSNDFYTNATGLFGDTIVVDEHITKGALIFTFDYDNVSYEFSRFFRFNERLEIFLTPMFNILTSGGTLPGFQAKFSFTNENEEHEASKLLFEDESIAINADIISWHWDFGDGSTSSLQNPKHTYTEEGIYEISLTISGISAGKNNLQISTISHPVYVYKRYESNIIFGQIFLGESLLPTLSDYGTAYLYHVFGENSIDSLCMIDSVNLCGYAAYSFLSIPEGNYIVKASLNPSSDYYYDYSQTYFGNQLFWQDAEIITLLDGNASCDINLIPKLSFSTGEGQAEGEIIAQTKSAGIENAYILLLNEEGESLMSSNSDADGNFGFSGLPYGTYNAYAELTGISGEPLTFTLDESNPEVGNLQFVVTETGIQGSINGTDENNISALSISPNPCINAVGINIPAGSPYTIRVYDLTAALILEQKGYSTGTIRLDASAWKPGVYFVNIVVDGQTQLGKLVKK